MRECENSRDNPRNVRAKWRVFSFRRGAIGARLVEKISAPNSLKRPNYQIVEKTVDIALGLQGVSPESKIPAASHFGGPLQGAFHPRCKPPFAPSARHKKGPGKTPGPGDGRCEGGEPHHLLRRATSFCRMMRTSLTWRSVKSAQPASCMSFSAADDREV